MPWVHKRFHKIPTLQYSLFPVRSGPIATLSTCRPYRRHRSSITLFVVGFFSAQRKIHVAPPECRPSLFAAYLPVFPCRIPTTGMAALASSSFSGGAEHTMRRAGFWTTPRATSASGGLAMSSLSPQTRWASAGGGLRVRTYGGKGGLPTAIFCIPRADHVSSSPFS